MRLLILGAGMFGFSWIFWVVVIFLFMGGHQQRRRFRRRMRWGGGGNCSYCGTNLNPAAQFCPQCGKPV